MIPELTRISNEIIAYQAMKYRYFTFQAQGFIILIIGKLGMNKELKQDLRSLGCPEEIMKELDHTSDEDRKLMLLKKYRKQLLENVHFEQKRLQDLDFIIFQMKKH